MINKIKSYQLWIISFVLMLALGIYQRTTGPTYPVKGKVEIAGKMYGYKLLRSHDTKIDAPFEMKVPDHTSGTLRFKRFKSNDEWTSIQLQPENGVIRAQLPHQPAAGKIEYEIILHDGSRNIPLTDEPVVIRFKGAVPPYILIPHIFFMFFAMVFSIRTGFEALLKRDNTYIFNTITMMLFLVGGLILGPIVQKYAFNAYWTGWPWGYDLTDNKTIIAFAFSLISWFVLRKNKTNRAWPITATIIMLAVYLIPHSVLGSEIDHTKTGTMVTPKNEIKP
ncbi:MAG: hypothetical protein HOO86_16555 [Bacteroidales bacterium]|nr:hypothetical protein [Bacteroidales bacterium]